ncbi:MAG: UDP-N-acetylmuramoyl-L-alanine--D-glutamate ligase [Candidatus Liptonbacteria bacterium]|nr:UDP-N-acetylmuramoyl-L-alanine--D-glutamate ligase [Candidatus Liptonbacteria bacterium]
MKLAILGFGREGQSILKFLQNRRLKRIKTQINADDKDEIWVLDKNIDIRIPRGVKTQLGKNYLKNLKQFDVIFRSPGIPYLSPEIQKAKKVGVEISSPTKLFFEELRGMTLNGRRQTQKLFSVSPRSVRASQRPILIGVTGTKGKGTTSSLIYKILKDAGKDAYLAGNIGKPALDLLFNTQILADKNADKRGYKISENPRLRQASDGQVRNNLRKSAYVILELSSFQLQDLGTSPHIAVALMVTSEHLDWHADVKEYAEAKANIVRFQSQNDYAVIAKDYPKSMSYARKTKARVFTFSRNTEVHPRTKGFGVGVKKGTCVERGYFWFRNGKKKEKVCATRELQIPGEHNWENAGAAITVAKILGIKNTAIAKAIHNFKGLEHRLEFVADIKGVKYYNDSYATTPETAEVAIAAFGAPKVLILGGSHKGSDFTRLGRVISRSKTVKAIIGVGKEWPRIKRHIKNPRVRIIEGCKNMKQIVQKAHAVGAPGDVVLLSPACASFGMFKNYTERGRQFKKLVKRLQ